MRDVDVTGFGMAVSRGTYETQIVRNGHEDVPGLVEVMTVASCCGIGTNVAGHQRNDILTAFY